MDFTQPIRTNGIPAGSPAADPLVSIRAALSAAGGGDASVTIGVIDGLPDLEHPLLRDAQIDTVAMMVPPGAELPDLHGTQIFSLLFGAGAPVRGLAPRCRGLALPIFFGRGDGSVHPASQIDLARAIAFALERGTDIINVSAGQKTATAEAETHLGQALARARENRALVVAAAGNDGCACIHLPAAVDHVLAVGALGTDGRPLESSNWGETYRRNGILAPGAGLAVASASGGAETAGGTSFATAVVSGTAALLLSLARRRGYRIDAADIGDILIETATPCAPAGDAACARYLAGALDAAAALAALHRAGNARLQPMTHQPRTRAASLPVAAPTIVTDKGENAMAGQRFRTRPAAAVTPSACACQTKPAAAENGVLSADEHDDEDGVDAATIDADDLGEDDDDGEAADLLPQSARRRSGALARMRASGARQASLLQQACGCGGSEAPQIVFVLGALWFDFGTEARYDAIVQQMGDPVRANSPLELIGFLQENLHFASGITFILMQDQIPLYAVQPAGPFALDIYNVMLRALRSCLGDSGKEQRVSIPGVVSGSTRLMNGMTVPVVYPDRRGMYQWNSKDLIDATRAAAPEAAPAADDDEILNFLNRVYYELRNLGVAPQERALNFAATNAYQARQAFAEATSRHLTLESISVAKSPICRPDSDCWDVQLTMFDPENERRANRVYRYTVDVSEVLPVTVGTVRTWAARAGSI